MAKVLFLVNNYFEQVEMTQPREGLQARGHEVTLAAAEERTVQGMQQDVNKQDTFNVDKLLSEVDAADYDAIVLPGGTVNADKLRIDPKAQALVKQFADGKVVAAICHAPWVLVSSGLAQGRKLAAFKTLKDDITNAGGSYQDVPVCVDGNFITSRQPDDIPQFIDAIDQALKAKG